MFSSPSQNISSLDLQSGMAVADLGSGSGHYALAAARAVGDKGKIYAIDVQKELLEKLKKEADRNRLFNVQIIWGNAEKIGGTKLKDECADAAIVGNILFQIEDEESFVAEIRRILKKRGRMLVVEWQDSFGGIGPHPKAVFSKAKTEALFLKSGFSLEREIEAGEHHYGLIFRKN